MTELSILAGMDSSAYLLVDDDHGVVVIRSVSHDPDEFWLPMDHRLAKNYRTCRLAWHSSHITLVPSRLYDGSLRSTYLSKLSPLPENYTVMADAIPALDLMLVYAIDKEKLTQWRSALVGGRFYHALTPLLQHLSQSTRRGEVQARMFAYIRDQKLTMIGLHRDKLLFCNTFDCLSAKDFLYFILLAFEQCKWKAHQVPLYLFGEFLQDSEIYRLMARYVRQIYFVENTRNMLKWGSRSLQQPEHFFYDLAALHQHK